MKENKRLLIECLKWIRLLIAIAFIIGICIYIQKRNKNAAEPDISSSFINGKLEAASDLTTVQLAYTGLIRYTQGNIPILTQKSFSMVYTASVRAGVDLSKARIQVEEDEVLIRLPECEIQSIDIDPDSIEFYDEKWALFNWTEKEDVIDTVSAAQEDVAQKADLKALLEHARYQTEAVIQGLLKDSIGERKLTIQ